MSHVHHVCWCLRPEDMDGAKQLWEARLGTELVDFVPPDLGIRVLINWDGPGRRRSNRVRPGRTSGASSGR